MEMTTCAVNRGARRIETKLYCIGGQMDPQITMSSVPSVYIAKYYLSAQLATVVKCHFQLAQ